jgi:hypothetical protein
MRVGVAKALDLSLSIKSGAIPNCSKVVIIYSLWLAHYACFLHFSRARLFQNSESFERATLNVYAVFLQFFII